VRRPCAAVRQAKSHITGSPFTARVAAADAVPAYCTAYGGVLQQD